MTPMYTTPERQLLVSAVVAAHDERAKSMMDFPWTIVRYLKSNRTLCKAQAKLIKYDRTHLQKRADDARNAYYRMPIEIRQFSDEEHQYLDAKESLKEHIDAYGDKI